VRSTYHAAWDGLDNMVMTEAYSHHEYSVVDGIHYVVFR
jgi:hypothetical protein